MPSKQTNQKENLVYSKKARTPNKNTELSASYHF